nr:phage holin family protein [Azotobacter vinelandii]WKN20479.1 phage holin family protein [Azotobacter vinelandii]
MSESTGNRNYPPNQANSDTSRPDLARADAVRPDVARPDAARPDPLRDETAQAATPRPEAVRTETERPSATIHRHTARAGGEEGGNSIMGLLGQLGRELPSLVTKELALAKVEIGESINATKAGVMSLASGGGVLLAGFIILLQAFVYALAQAMDAWLAAAIVGVIVMVIGYVMVKGGRKKFAPSAFKPSRTLHALQKDKAAIRENAP